MPFDTNTLLTVIAIVGALFGVWSTLDKQVAILRAKSTIQDESTRRNELLVAALRVEYRSDLQRLTDKVEQLAREVDSCPPPPEKVGGE